MTASISVDGFLNINKSAGVTSRDVVNAFQRRLRNVSEHDVRCGETSWRKTKVGHAGTLDPMATGVLVLAFGRATKLIRFVQQMPKAYHAHFRLGMTSDTDDIWGTCQATESTVSISQTDVAQALAQQVGTISQLPPAYSALKVQGQRAYDLARRGETPDLKPRLVTISRIELLRFEFPEVELEIECGSGTYVRSIARDLGETLGCGAVMSALQRTAVGSFQLGKARSPQDLEDEFPWPLISVAEAFQHYPTVQLSDDQISSLKYGRPLEFAATRPEATLVAVDGNGQFLAWLEKDNRREQERYRAAVNWVPAM